MTAGAGHRRAAEAIAQALAAAHPESAIECRDLLDDVPAWLRWFYPRVYYFLIRRTPWLWGGSFELLDWRPVYPLVRSLRRAWNVLMARRFIRRLRHAPYDLILVTHFFPADVASACKRAGWIRAPLVVMVTDLYPHRFWLSPEAEAYAFATEEGARVARERGIAPGRLHVTGIPIAAEFHAAFDRAELERQLGLVSGRRTALVTSGGSTVGPFEQVVAELANLESAVPGQLQLLVICGHDQCAVERLRARARGWTMPVRALGFIDTMPQAMAVSDLVVAKAGGLTVAEALGRGLPLVIFHTIPGQERMNAEHAAAHGAAIVAGSPGEAASAVRRFVEEPTFSEAMRRSARALSRPHAAQTIVSDIVQPLLERQK